MKTTEQSVAYLGRVKYTPSAAEKYQIRKEGKHRAEMRLIDRAFQLIPKTARVLDVPCGGGRVSVHLGQQGYQMACGDLSESMLAIARENVAKAGLACPVERQDVERLSYADQSFDAIVSFRLFHHFPNPDIRQRVIREFCRVARTHVALSYFSPVSITSVKRKVKAALGGKRSDKSATSLAEVTGYFENAGFRLVKDFAQLPLLHTMHLAVFQRA